MNWRYAGIRTKRTLQLPMPIRKFPDPRKADDEDGLVAVGGDLSVPSLLLAYRKGIFPWPAEGLPLLWFCPPQRAILRLEELHVPRSLERSRKKALREGWRFSIDLDFAAVVEACSAIPRPGQPGTWILPEMKEAYLELHRAGYAHSVEAWRGTELVGGLYGVSVDGIFAGESMFHRESDASKLALLHLLEVLGSRGCDWIDIQMMTPHMAMLGARQLRRDEFLDLLERSLKSEVRLLP